MQGRKALDKANFLNLPFKVLLTGRVPVNKELLTGTVPVNKDLLAGTVPVNKELLTGTVPVNKELLTGRVSVNNIFLYVISAIFGHLLGYFFNPNNQIVFPRV